MKPENILDMPVQHLAQNDESKVKAFIFASIFLKFTLPHKLWSAILNFVRKYWQKCQNVLNTKKELTTNREKSTSSTLILRTARLLRPRNETKPVLDFYLAWWSAIFRSKKHKPINSFRHPSINLADCFLLRKPCLRCHTPHKGIRNTHEAFKIAASVSARNVSCST